MGHFSNLSIDTRTCGEAAEDAALDRRDGILVTPRPAYLSAHDDVTTRIAYEHGDYACYATVEGVEEYIGSRGNYTDASTLCREYRFTYYADRHTPEKAAAIAMEQEPPVTYARPAEPAADMLYACPCLSDDGQPGGSGGGGGAPMQMPEGDWLDTDGMRVPAPGRILTYCTRCGAPGTTTDPDADYVCPDCLATTATPDPAATLRPLIASLLETWKSLGAATPYDAALAQLDRETQQACAPPASDLAAIGAAHAVYFHDQPERFFAQLDTLSGVEIGEVMVALGAFWQEPIEVVSADLTRTRALLTQIAAPA